MDTAFRGRRLSEGWILVAVMRIFVYSAPIARSQSILRGPFGFDSPPEMSESGRILIYDRPSRPCQSSGACDPVGAVNPGSPAGPVGHVDPVHSVSPVVTVDLGGLVDSVFRRPSRPSQPSRPRRPSWPNRPSRSSRFRRPS